MMISTRGRYSIRVLVDLAQNQGDGFIPMKDVAKRQELSLKYLEQILPILTKNHLVESAHGKGGGYRLTRKPSEYPISEILKLTEGDMAPVACLQDDAPVCERHAECKTVVLWEGLNKVINDYLSEHTLEEFL